MADKKKNFYVVLKGRQPGIYTRWSGAGGAEDQVKGFAGAVFRGFATRAEADYFLKSGGQMPQAALLEAARSTGPAKTPLPDHQADLLAGKIVIFTDGASTGNPGPGGYGAVLLYGEQSGEQSDEQSGEQRSELSGGFQCTTNNRMELMACIAALQSLKRRSQVVLYSDSRYVVNGVQQGWARRWRANNWMRAPGSDGIAKRAENVDLWARLLDLLEQHQVDFRWVKGHADTPENERCDRLAVEAAHRPNLPADPGFKR